MTKDYPLLLELPHLREKLETIGVLDNSKRDDFLRCNRYFFFRHVLGLRGKHPSHDLVFGSAWHDGMEALSRFGIAKKGALDAAMQSFLACYREAFGPATDDDKKPKNPMGALNGYKTYIEQYKADPFEHLHFELGVPVPLGGDRVYYGKLDKISRRTTDNRYLVIDHKTSKYDSSVSSEKWESRNQFFGYIHALYCFFPPEEVEGLLVDESIFYHTAKDGYKAKHQRYLVRKSPLKMQEWLINIQYHYDRIVEQLELMLNESTEQQIQKSFPRCYDDRGCISFNRICLYYHHCWSSPNPLKDYGQPKQTPLEFIREYWDPRSDPVSEVYDPDTGEVRQMAKERHPIDWSALDEGEEQIVKPGLFSSIMNK